MDLAVPELRRRMSGSAEAQRRGRLGPFRESERPARNRRGKFLRNLFRRAPVGASRPALLQKGDPSLHFRPQISQGYPPNLSILLSGGKETNKDSPSNGE